MLSINTNLSSLIVQNSMKQSTNSLNQAIERMTTGFKINHSKDNAANYAITTNMSTNISALDIAEDNTAMGIDLLTTADSTLELITDKLQRLRALAVQTSNGTYGDQSKEAINQEANSIIDEMQRLHSTTEYNGKKIMGDDFQPVGFMKPVEKFTPRNTDNLTKLGSVADDVALADGIYSISTAAELAQLAEMTNAGLISEGDEFVLASDIDLIDYTTGEGWVPIGTNTNKFLGTFDGNGHTIKNLYINRPSSNFQGLLGCSEGDILNLEIKNADLYVKGCSAILVGMQDYGDVSNCSVEGKIVSTFHSIGGLVGQVRGDTETKIGTCSAEVTINGDRNLGGLIGLVAKGSTITVDNCYSISKIDGGYQLGGLLGHANDATNVSISNCYANTNIVTKNTSTNVAWTGGLIGAASGNVSIADCSVTGSIRALAEGTKNCFIGGFIGGQTTDAEFLNINSCYSDVDIVVEGATDELLNIGGFCGGIQVGASINNCYATGGVVVGNTPFADNIGGFIGYIDRQKNNNTLATIENCYNKNKIEINTTKLLDGSNFIGYIGGSGNALVKNCYTLADSESDIDSIWCCRNVNAGFAIENSYHSKELVNAGLKLFTDPDNNPINIESELSQVKSCATDDPFKFYFNQQTGLQVGTGVDQNSRITVDTTCSLDYMNILRNIGLQDDDYLTRIDELLSKVNDKQTQIGAGNNRLMSAMEEITIRRDNLVSSRSTLRDADIAEVSSEYIRQQILQQASATLLATANQSASIALSLI